MGGPLFFIYKFAKSCPKVCTGKINGLYLFPEIAKNNTLTSETMIREKLLEIQKAVTALKKDSKAFNYDYVSGDKVLSIIRPHMDKLGVLLIPQLDDIELTPITYKEWSSKAQAMIEKTEVLTKLSMTMVWMDTEDGSTLEVKWGATGQNGFDKGFGSALTYGERYFLLKFFHLQTDKDDVDAVNTERDKQREVTEAEMARIQQEQRQAERMENIEHWAMCEVDGWVSKFGVPARQRFAEVMNPTDEEMQFYLKAVTRYTLQRQAGQQKR